MKREKLNRDIIRMWTEPASHHRNDELYALIVGGCGPSAWIAADEMIRANIGLGINIVNQYLSFLPEYKSIRDDLISASLLGITEAVAEMIKQGYVENHKPTQFIALRVQIEIGKAMTDESMIRIPRSSKQRHKIPTPTTRELGANDISYDPTSMRELRGMIDGACADDTDREIVALREQGYVDSEIAEILDLPHTTTYVKRRMIYSRFLELTGWKGQP